MTEHTLNITAAAPARFSVQQFSEMVPAFNQLGLAVELDHGAIVKTNLPHFPHSDAVRSIAKALEDALAGSGLLVYSDIAVELPESTVRVPDVAVIQHPGRERRFAGAEHFRLVVEVSNDSLRYDLGLKAESYAAGGIADFWVFDLEDRQIHVHSKIEDGSYANVEVVPFGAPLTAACLPGPLTLAL